MNLTNVVLDKHNPAPKDIVKIHNIFGNHGDGGTRMLLIISGKKPGILAVLQ